MLIVKRPWTRQPPPAARIDWSNPLTKGLVFCAVPAGYTYFDAVTRVFGTVAGTHTKGIYTKQGGYCGSVDGVQAMAASGSTSDIISWPASATLRGGSLVQTGTLLALAGTTEQVDAKQYAVMGNCETSGGHGFGLAIDSYGAFNRGGIRKWNYTAKGGETTYESLGNPFDNRLHFFGYAFSGNGVSGMWFSRGEARTFSGGATNGTNTAGRIATINATYPTSAYGSQNHNCYVALGLMWDRPLAASEYLALYDNPWQLFEPQRAYIGEVAAAGGVPNLSSATYKPGSLTTVGFQPRVTAS